MQICSTLLLVAFPPPSSTVQALHTLPLSDTVLASDVHSLWHLSCWIVLSLLHVIPIPMDDEDYSQIFSTLLNSHIQSQFSSLVLSLLLLKNKHIHNPFCQHKKAFYALGCVKVHLCIRGVVAVFDAVGQAALTLPYAGGCAAATAFNPKEHLSGTPDCLCHPLKKSWHKHVCVCLCVWWRGADYNPSVPVSPQSNMVADSTARGGWDRHESLYWFN